MELYNMKGEKRCIILDYIDSPVDVDVLRSTFERFNFTIDSPPHDQLSLNATQQLLEEASKSNHGQCLLVCILSTGDQSALICSDGERFTFEDIFAHFDGTACGALHQKPKLFFLKHSHIVQQSNGGLSLNKTSDTLLDDFFICSATFSEFLLTLCNVINCKHQTYSLLQMVSLVKEIGEEALGEKLSRDSTLTKMVMLEK